MSDDIDDIAAHYDADPEQEHERLTEHQLEHDLTWRYLDRYLPERGAILEVGAATGRYAIPLARRGFAVTAVDLSSALIAEAKRRLAREERDTAVRFVVADARDLSGIAQTEFDAVLMMGPLYHLIVPSDRTLALREAYDRMREGGVIFTSFLSRFGVIGDLLRNAPEWIEDQTEVRSLLDTGRRPDHYPRGGFRGYFARAAEIAPLHEAVGFRTVTVAGVEPAISADDESFNKLQGAQRRLWLDLLQEISEEPSIVAASRHLLYVGVKGA